MPDATTEIVPQFTKHEYEGACIRRKVGAPPGAADAAILREYEGGDVN